MMRNEAAAARAHAGRHADPRHMHAAGAGAAPPRVYILYMYRCVQLTKINENESCFHTQTLTAYDARPAALATPGSRLLSL